MDRPRRRSSALCLATLVTIASSAVAQESPDLLADVRAALGTGSWGAMKGALRIEGDFSSSSASGPIEILIDRDGRFTRRVDGDLDLVDGFDGTTAWARDWMSTPRVLELGDREAALFATLLLTPLWTDEGGPFRVEELPPAESRPGGTLTVRLRGGLMEGVVTVHPDSALPRTVSVGSAEGAETTTFADWREISGIRLPWEVTVTRKSGGDRFVVRKVTGPVPVDGETLRPRLEPPDDTTFARDAPPRVPARRVRAGNLLVEARLDGGEPGWFIVDTGAGATVVSKAAAARLQGDPVGSVSAVGTGGSVSSKLRRAQSLDVGPMTIRSPVLVEIDLGFLTPHFGCEVAGILGFDVWARAVVEIDAKEPGITLRDPAKASAAGPASVPLVLSARLPCVKARFEGDHEALFMIDTGAGQTTATFHAGAAKTFGIPGDRPWKRRFASGVGGLTSQGDVGLAWFEVGGHRFDSPRVGFDLRSRGRREEEHTAGSIGARFLEPFVLVLDYRNRRLALKPRE